MGKTCAVPTCAKTNENGVTLHQIPKSANHDDWLEFLQLANDRALIKWKQPKNIRICSDHFLTTCFNPFNVGIKKVLAGHHPTMVNPNDQVMICKECYKPTPQLHQAEIYDFEEMTPTVENEPVQDLIEEKQRKIEQLEAELTGLKNDLRILKQKLKRTQESAKRKAESMETTSKKVKIETTEASAQTTLVCTNTGNASRLVCELFHSLASNKHNMKYSKFMKEFAFRLHYLSPRAYQFLRKEMDLLLPHPFSFSRWTRHIDTSPGFLPSSLQYISKQTGKVYGLIMDEIHIRKKITYDGQRMHGYADYGTFEGIGQADGEARTALFIMASEINGTKTIPIAYVLANSLQASQLAGIIRQCLVKMHSVGGKVISITFDGLPANFKAAEQLGANLNVTSPDFSPFFLHPISNEQVFVILDPSHMTKLLRNALKAQCVFYDENKNLIKWEYVESLVKLQSSSGLRAANKLTIRHSSFENQKMKTRLCTQVLSNSVAVALDVCQKLNIPDFAGSEATSAAFKRFDKLFDMLNGRVYGVGYKASLRIESERLWKPFFVDTIEYLKSLKYMCKKGYLIPILSSRLFTFARGLIITLQSTIGIMATFVGENKCLKFLSMYRISQDHLEMFFSVLRTRLGCNNNPSAFDLLHMLKPILAIRLEPSRKGNCISLEEYDCSVSELGQNKTLVGKDMVSPDDTDTAEDLPPFETLSLFVNNVVVYLAGFVCKQLCASLPCPVCIQALLPISFSSDNVEYTLLHEKNNGGLFIPREEVVQICKMTESYIRSQKVLGIKFLDSKKIVQKMCMEAVEHGAFKDLKHESRIDSTVHTFDLIKKIVATYTKIRLHYIAKEETLGFAPTTTRNTCTKTVHFAGH